ANPRPSGKRDSRHLRRVLSHTQLLQMDSIYVLERAHYMPVFSRLGAYPHALVDNAAYRGGDRTLFEYWGHAASLLPVELFPLFRWRMSAAEEHAWETMKRIASENPGLVERLYEEVAARGPVSARELEEAPPRSRDNWGWNWSDSKKALEWLFRCGRISVAARPGFERLYDLTERVIPRRYLDAPAPERAEAKRQLMARSAAALGVATEIELRDYFRLSVTGARTALRELLDDGVIQEVSVESCDKPAYLHRDARLPRRVAARALLSPFDPLVWHRDRTHRLWDFFYRIEIYVPEAKRVHGYYVLPFLLGDRLVARVDLKADRPAGVLRVPAVWHEDHVDGDTGRVAAELAAELRELATWLGLSDVAPPGRGDLAPALSQALRATG
ncbi:MAG: winged helix-turn-helix domain-containing protein, partial [Stackebrandtia sp.]